MTEHTSWNLASPADLIPLFDSIESEADDSIRRLGIIEESSNVLIGTIGFHTVSTINKTAEIAFDIAPLRWGRGIGRAVCEAATQWAFDGAGWVRVQAVVLDANERSASVLRACGFQREGYLRDYRMVRGAPSNFVLYSRLARDGPLA